MRRSLGACRSIRASTLAPATTARPDSSAGARIKKNALRIERTVPSTNYRARSASLARSCARCASASTRAARLDAWLAWTQDVLFNLGSRLATLPERSPRRHAAHRRRRRRGARTRDRRSRSRSGAAQRLHSSERIVPRRATPRRAHDLPARRTPRRNARRSAMPCRSRRHVSSTGSRTRCSSGRAGSTTDLTNPSTAGTPTRPHRCHPERSAAAMSS